jgi:hypothetical protein
MSTAMSVCGVDGERAGELKSVSDVSHAVVRYGEAGLGGLGDTWARFEAVETGSAEEQ